MWMLPWPGVEVEAGKRGGIKEVFGGRASRPEKCRFYKISCDGIGQGWLWHFFFFSPCAKPLLRVCVFMVSLYSVLRTDTFHAIS